MALDPDLLKRVDEARDLLDHFPNDVPLAAAQSFALLLCYFELRDIRQLLQAAAKKEGL